MSESMHDDPLRSPFTAYREAEPRRTRSPFTDPRLAAEAARRSAAASRPALFRFLMASPVASALPALLAFALLLTPAAPRSASEVDGVVTPLAAPLSEGGATPTTDRVERATRVTEGDATSDGAVRLLLLAAGGTLLAVTVTRLRARG